MSCFKAMTRVFSVTGNFAKKLLPPENMKKMVTPSNELFEVSRKFQPQERNCTKVTGGTMTKPTTPGNSVKWTAVLNFSSWMPLEIQ